MFVKLYTNTVFDKQGFRDMLVQKCNIRCAVVDDGIILDKEAFNKADLPEWAKLNQEDVNSSLHTRPATEEEYNQARQPRYILYSYAGAKDTELTAIFMEDNLLQMKQVADDWWLVTHRVAIVVDSTTGEVVYEG